MSKLIAIRHNPKHSVVAHVTDTQDGCALLRLTPDTGNMPEWQDLVGVEFPNYKALRLAILSRMRDLFRSESQLTTFDRVIFQAAQYARWQRLVERTASKLAHLTNDIPTEQVEVKPDGRLHLFIELDGQMLVEMFIPQADWKWQDQ